MKSIVPDIRLRSPRFKMTLEPWHVMVLPIFVALVILLVFRPIGLALDDQNYIDYFSGAATWAGQGFFHFLLSEPFWRYYAKTLGGLLGIDAAFRFTVFLSLLMYFYSAVKLSNGKWKFIVLFFVLCAQMATQMYFNQLREGFALSVFLFIMAIGLGPVLAAILAAFFHSSFIIIIPCAIAARVFKNKRYASYFVLLGIGLIVLVLNHYLGDVNLGRRTETYALAGQLNIKYYLLFLPLWVATFYFLKPQAENAENIKFWYYFVLFVSAAALGITFIYAAGARLIYLAFAFLAILVALYLPRKRAYLIGSTWLAFFLSLQVYQAIKYGIGPHDYWLGRWISIVGSLFH